MLEASAAWQQLSEAQKEQHNQAAKTLRDRKPGDLNPAERTEAVKALMVELNHLVSTLYIWCDRP